MKKTLVLLLISTLLISLLGSCKKYEEGPWLSLRSKETRMNGEWDITKFLINNIDSSHYFTKYDYSKVIFNRDNLSDFFWASYDNQSNPKEPILLYGKWNWKNDKEGITISINSSKGSIIPPFSLLELDQECYWEIKRLTNSEFYLETNCDGDLFRLELKR